MLFGFIGCGHMGAELARCTAKQKNMTIWLSNRTPEKAEVLAKEIGGKVVSNEEIAQKADVIFLGARPQDMELLCSSISPFLSKRTNCVIITMAAGLTMKYIRQLLQTEAPMIRIMPNTPLSVNEGVILYAVQNVSNMQEEDFCRVFRSSSLLVKMDEESIDAAGCISGCGPAYVYRFIESFANAGEKMGLDTSTSMNLVLKTMLGSLKMIESTHESPAVLCGKVCSKGGTTEKGVNVMNQRNIDSLMEEALSASLKRTLELKK